ncbi:MAG: hypothetical protein K0U98_27465 [Deltaproteobacteria bacterium]|nr:hypothetical protein [Deltaproteobacteria bacterium]
MFPLPKALFCSLVLFLALIPELAFAQACPVHSDSVEIRLRTPSSSVGATTRREHIRISQGLLEALCIDSNQIHSNGDNSPQVRVVITSDTNAGAPSNPKSTGLFTIVGVDTSSSARWVEIYTRRNSSDKNNGLLKLFPYLGNGGTLDATKVTAEVYSIAPHATSYVDYQFFWTRVQGTTTHYSNPNTSGQQFEEYLQLETSKELALLLPHGDNIETHLDEQIGRFEVGTNSHNLDANIWEGRGRWGNNETFRRWHITSSDFNPVSFPGLQDLFDAPDYASGRPFRWAVGLHGFTGRKLTTHPDSIPSSDQGGAYYGVILGGRSHADTKCYLAHRLQDSYLSRRDQVAITIIYHDSNNIRQTIEIPGIGGVIDDTDDLGGVDRENIANRLAPWSSGQMDRGAVQVELSQSLRFDEHFSAPHTSNPKSQLLERTISALAKGMGQLNSFPNGALGACAELKSRNNI